MTAEEHGRRLRITHRTGLRYAGPVHASFNEVRMTPNDGDGQVLLSHRLDVTPSAGVTSYVDYWGAFVEAFDVHEEHRVLEVVSTSTVEVTRAPVLAGSASWEDLADPAVRDRWCEYLDPTGYVDDAAADPDRVETVRMLRALPTPRVAVAAAVAVVRERMTYTPGVTTVSTTAHEAWNSGHGVCQDFSHATLSLLRAVGVPSRYVSGYLHTEEPAVGSSVHGESHAWVECWTGGWEAHDPTNDRYVGVGHVVVARGRDYGDVPPLKGIYNGERSEELGVSVEILQLPS
ncbi:MAG: transglutaminase family protein [Candidatus Nanopelagicales bacterium]